MGDYSTWLGVVPCGAGAVCVFLYVVFVGTEVWLKSGVVRILGVVLAVVVPVCLLGLVFGQARAPTTGPALSGGA